MITFLKRLVGKDDRIQKANAKLLEQYTHLDTTEVRLDDLCKKLDGISTLSKEDSYDDDEKTPTQGYQHRQKLSSGT